MRQIHAIAFLLVSCALLGCDESGPAAPGNSALPASAPPTAAAPGSTAADPPPAVTWSEFSFPEAGFKIMFPCFPTLRTTEGPSKSYSALGADATGTVRVESAAPDQLDQKLKGLIEQQPRWQKEPVQTKVTLAGQPAVEVVSEAEPGKFRRVPPITVVRYLKTDSALYIVSLEVRPENSQPLREAYFNSFLLIPVEATAKEER
jgi:hypothetical protein